MLGSQEIDRDSGTTQAAPQAQFVFAPGIAPGREQKHERFCLVEQGVRHHAIKNDTGAEARLLFDTQNGSRSAQ